MALNQITLRDGILDAFTNSRSSTTASANALGAAYHSYASSAKFGGTQNPTLVGKDAALKSTIASGMVGDLATWCASWASGLTAYWAAVPTSDGINTGLTTSIPGAASLAAAIQAGLTPYPSTTSEAADAISSALHTATLTCFATQILPPPRAGTILPIS